MTETNHPTLKPLNVLILEDSEPDAMLVAIELGKAGYRVSWKQVDTERDFVRELDQGGYDLVLSDNALPSFSALGALKRFREKKQDIPFIVVSGSLGEEQAVELMRQGADDYLIKDRLARLGSAVAAALEQKRLRDENSITLQRLHENEERFRRLAENAPGVIYRFRLLPTPGFEYISPVIERLCGYSVEEFMRDPLLRFKVIHPEDLPKFNTNTRAENAMHSPSVMRWIRKDGSIIWVEVRNAPVFDAQGKPIAVDGILGDVTARVQREREREALISITSGLRDALTRAEIYPVVLQKASDLIKADAAAITSCGIDNTAPVDAASGRWSAWQGARLELGEEILQRVVVEGKPYDNPDVTANAPGIPAAWISGLKRLHAVPLKALGEVLGILWVGQCESSEAREQESLLDSERLLVAMADITASALQRARLYEETHQRVQQLTALRTIDRAITASLDLHLMLSVLVDQLMIQKDVDAVEVLLLDPYTHQLNHAEGRGFKGRGQEGAQFRMGESLAGRAVLTRSILSIPDFSANSDPLLQKSPYLAEGFRSYLGVPLITQGAVLGVLEILRRSAQPFERDWLEFVESLVGQVAIAINNAELFEKLQRSAYDVIQAYDATIEGWSRALEMRGIESRGHTDRVVWLTTKLARAVGLPDHELVHLRRGVLLHDIGTMALPDSLLLKPGPLSEEERAVMRQHPVYAFEWLSPIIYLHPALDIPYAHHEAWDGSGYPRGLKGAQISLPARIFAVVDVWDALRSDRPFRAAWPKDQALQYLKSMSGIQFDPQVVAAFIDLIQAEESEGEDF